jgi:GT2 family glycosyltransferase
MGYRLLDIETTAPLPAPALEPGEDGLAVVVRRHGRPVGYFMEAQPPAGALSADDFAGRLVKHAGQEVLGVAVRAALGAEPPARPLPALTLAICTRDRPALLDRCLGSLAPLRAAAEERALEVLVVDNAPSDDQTRDLVALRPAVRYVVEPRPGLDFARNRALAEATGTFVAYLDDDVVVDAGWLDGFAEAWRTHPDAAGFTGLVLPYALETEAQVLFERTGGFRKGFDRARFGARLKGSPLYPAGAGFFGTGANMVFRRDVLLALGGFDEALDTGAALPGGGDLDVFYRLIRAGHVLVYEPRCLVFHEHRRGMDALRRQYERSWGTSFTAFMVKSYRTDPPMRPRLRRYLLDWFAGALRQAGRSLAGRSTLPPAMALAELKGGLTGLAGGYGRSVRRAEGIRARHP